MSEEAVKKGMVNWFDLTVDRRSNGVSVYAKADPRVETFMAGLGYGQTDSADLYGRMWVPVGDAQLKVYKVAQELTGRFHDHYTIDYPCGPFDLEGRLNLSLLRLAGLTDGVSFRLEIPMSRSRVSTLKTQLIEGIGEFLREYIVPVNVKLKIVSNPTIVELG